MPFRPGKARSHTVQQWKKDSASYRGLVNGLFKERILSCCNCRGSAAGCQAAACHISPVRGVQLFLLFLMRSCRSATEARVSTKYGKDIPSEEIAALSLFLSLSTSSHTTQSPQDRLMHTAK